MALNGLWGKIRTEESVTMLMNADEAIVDIAEHAYLQGAGAESAQLRERRDAAEEAIQMAFAIAEEVEECLDPVIKNHVLRFGPTWAKVVIKRATGLELEDDDD